MVISILIERNISDEPFAATGSLYFHQQMAAVSRINTTWFRSTLFIYLIDINSV